MNPADGYQLGNHLTIDQVDEWLKEATESRRRSPSSCPTSDLEVDVVDIVGFHSTSTTGSVERRCETPLLQRFHKDINSRLHKQSSTLNTT
ncbi:hypothetical protein PSHT_11643 [Puccinia striiformis]|uniref:Uncharacterized protein n=1 Tax=Puccinia striiformis TaxID=27350 RepID=A0A2S4V228_9BASI|nr:hypothetical protein PSHT_11643 [Puccinia striiformis]